MKISKTVLVACMGIVLSFILGSISAFAAGENRQAERIIIDQIVLREPLKDVILNVPRDRMRVQEVDPRGKNPKLKIHRRGDAPDKFINVDDIYISSPIYYSKYVGEGEPLRYRDREFAPGFYYYGIELTTTNPNYYFEADLQNYFTLFTLEMSNRQTPKNRTTSTYRFSLVGEHAEGNNYVLHLAERDSFWVKEEYPLKEVRLFLPEKDLQYGKLGEAVPDTTWKKPGEGLLDRNGEETWPYVSIPYEGDKVSGEYTLEDISTGKYYGAGERITKPGTYRRVLRDVTFPMNIINPYRITLGGLDGSLETKFYINDKEWEIDSRKASLNAIDPVRGGLKVTLYDPDYITLTESNGNSDGISKGSSGSSTGNSGGSFGGGGDSTGGKYSSGGSSGSSSTGSSAGSGGGSSVGFSGSLAGQVLGADRSLSNGEWVKDEKGWWYKRKDGSYPKNTWGYEEYNGKSYWYYFLDSGYMATGWVDLNGSKYYLFPGSDGWMGRMLIGWQWIDGYCYYLGADSGNNEGHLYRNEKTPDGYQVDKEGRWVENGVPQIKK
ncbi:N-acetylmuramoyl-L-alanine amidase family protein [Oribacterium sinus]|uniref:Cell wall-binding repeat protein n=1 Tax=Oribacterium sinus F0268 TaxID=585501 RepID=C2KUT1_9FIRM|nr:hypothetical protein [Oribacterium sinus]EEJ52494.1 cell wall-binding repeat protein [Oribacterium sinus F0268]